MPKKSKSQIEVHGKIESPKTEPTTLEQIWGFNELSKYGTTNETEYDIQLKDMNRAELESHARKVGIVIVENSGRLRDKLMHEFKAFFASLHRPVNPNPPSKEKITPEIRKILSEGR